MALQNPLSSGSANISVLNTGVREHVFHGVVKRINEFNSRERAVETVNSLSGNSTG